MFGSCACGARMNSYQLAAIYPELNPSVGDGFNQKCISATMHGGGVSHMTNKLKFLFLAADAQSEQA